MDKEAFTQRARERFTRLRDDGYRRNEQIKRWRDMYFLRWKAAQDALDDQEIDHEFVTDNLPHEKVELAVDTLCFQEPIVEVPVTEEIGDDSEMSGKKRVRKAKRIRTQAEQLERFLSGYWQRLEAEEGENTGRLLVLDALSTGYAVARVFWDEERIEDQLPVVIQHVKPECFFNLKGRRGDLVQVAIWERNKAEVEDEWGVELPGVGGKEGEDKTAIFGEFVDYWEAVKEGKEVAIWHLVFFDDQVVHGPVETSYRDLPYEHAMPKPTGSDDEGNQALPFIFGMKDLWETMNRHASDARDMLRYFADPAKIVRTGGGMKPPNLESGGVRGATVYLNRDLDEDARFLQWEGAPPDFFRFGNWLNSAADRVGFSTPYLTGNPDGASSGWHWTQSTSTQKVKVRPYRTAIEHLRQNINRALLRRLEEHPEIGKVTVYGRDRADQRYVAELDVKKIKGQYINLVRINDHVPYDDIQIAQLIRTYREPIGGMPFLPDRFLRNTIAQVPYNEEIEQQIADQVVAFHERTLEFQTERLRAMQEIKMKQEQPTVYEAMRETRARERPRTPPPPAPPNMGGLGGQPGLPPPPGGMPMAPAAPPVALGQSVPALQGLMGTPPPGRPPGGPMMKPFMPGGPNG